MSEQGKTGQRVRLLIGAVLLGTIVFALAVTPNDRLLTTAGLIFGLALGYPFALLMHELGHACFGGFAGLRPVQLAVGPVSFSRAEGQRISVRVHPTNEGGFLVAVPISAPVKTRQLIILVAGGPLTSLGLCLVFWLLAGQSTADGAFLALSVLAAFNGLLAVMTLLPFGHYGGISDGIRLWGLWRGNKDGREFQAAFNRAAIAWSPERPAQWPVTADALAAVVQDQGLAAESRLSALMMLLYHTLDGGERQPAKGLLGTAADLLEEGHLVPALKEQFEAELSLLTLFLVDHHPDQAWPTFEPYQKVLAAALLAIRAGDIDAPRLVAKAQAFLNEPPKNGISDLYCHLLDEALHGGLPLR